MTKPRILVVDDDRAVRSAIAVNLRRHDWTVTLAQTTEEAIQQLRESLFDVVLTDVRMPGATGLDLLTSAREAWPDVPIVVMTGHGSVADAVAAMKVGAADYLIKPIATQELLMVLERALERKALRAELALLRREVDDRYGFENLIGATKVMVDLYDQIAAVADSSATVLLQGPTGTGKELLAHAIHYRSPRATAPFIRVNCSAIPQSLLESEFFGHEKGAFTGAIRQHQGKFEQADGGTLLLDEVGEINPYMQVKLLRVLENGEFQRVGGSSTLQVDVRVIAATNKDLLEETRSGSFRKDLFYRLNVVALSVPPLCERRDDIPLLVDHFLRKYSEKNSRPTPHLAPEVLDALRSYHWPGNVRQLEHLVERAVILNRAPRIDKLDLPEDHDSEGAMSILPPLGESLQDALAAYERKVIVAALQDAGGVQARAARRLGLSRSNLNYRISRLGIRVKEIRYD